MRAPVAALAGAVLLAGVPGAASAARPSHFVCDVGPVRRDFGGAPWLVYSCGDARTLLFEGAPGGKAASLYFEVSLEADGAHLGGRSGEGQEVTGAAFREVAALPRDGLAALLAATEAAR
ncbi:MAG TPA: hypothetical protein VG843_14515 [Rhizomicrobium sp.]|jgi:hypothetical protein|nr:hypothetical protein [Rhizomicrobium sp.]